MSQTNKLTGSERRKTILDWLRKANEPITGGELANKAGVSRQVIVQDISLLKAKNKPIVATSQGYIYMTDQTESNKWQRIIACHHEPEETRQELECIVDHGVTVKNVIIEHPIYGDLEASIMVSDRHDVNQFIDKVASTKAPYLLELTNGVHLHTIEAESKTKLEAAYQSLKKLGFIIDNK
ncbi:transcriptional regulator of NAD metabolism [Natronobacillus azotifigens]|uniref:Transcription repressor NadR n=1 Tax=Natronobacillus azotifigens TaxID=472978 RepID=A0A9J6R9S2_9BACI|nr:transcription repressor NadR [Natronobacillus azotifigens]MCZ0702384.1 transcription repressor NadR [Natronobacillus azotifigens]